MQQYSNDQILYSPSNLITFLGYHYARFLDVKALLGVTCSTVQQMMLINTFYWLDNYANKANLNTVKQ